MNIQEEDIQATQIEVLSALCQLVVEREAEMHVNTKQVAAIKSRIVENFKNSPEEIDAEMQQIVLVNLLATMADKFNYMSPDKSKNNDDVSAGAKALLALFCLIAIKGIR